MHTLDPSFPDQVGDELQLVEALVVGDLGLISRLDKGLETELNQLRDTAAQHGLLAEEVGLGLLREARLHHAGAGGAERGTVGEGELAGPAARVLRDGDDGRCAVALGVETPDDVAGTLRRDHDHVVSFGRRDAPVVDVEPVCEEERRARLEIRRDLLLVELRLRAVGHEEGDELCAAHRVGERRHRQAGLLGGGCGRTSLAQADDHVDT